MSYDVIHYKVAGLTHSFSLCQADGVRSSDVRMVNCPDCIRIRDAKTHNRFYGTLHPSLEEYPDLSTDRGDDMAARAEER